MGMHLIFVVVRDDWFPTQAPDVWCVTMVITMITVPCWHLVVSIRSCDETTVCMCVCVWQLSAHGAVLAYRCFLFYPILLCVALETGLIGWELRLLLCCVLLGNFATFPGNRMKAWHFLFFFFVFVFGEYPCCHSWVEACKETFNSYIGIILWAVR